MDTLVPPCAGSVPITNVSHSRCDGQDSDWYEVNLEAGNHLRVSLELTTAPQDTMRITLWRLDDDGVPVEARRNDQIVQSEALVADGIQSLALDYFVGWERSGRYFLEMRYGDQATDKLVYTLQLEQTPLEILDDVEQIDASGDHSCALTGNSQVYCWGFADADQLTGESGHRSRPDYVLLAPPM